MACGGELDGVRLLGMSTILKAIEEQYYGTDRVLGIPMRRGLHFVLNSKEMPLGPNPRTFSGSGWGGSRLIIDPDIRLSWSYVMNKMANMGPDPRSIALSQALYAAI
jgi:CubicO group peptidase (beta-lactamase class C family)